MISSGIIGISYINGKVNYVKYAGGGEVTPKTTDAKHRCAAVKHVICADDEERAKGVEVRHAHEIKF